MKKSLLLVFLFFTIQFVASSVALLLVNVQNLQAGKGLDEKLLSEHPSCLFYTLLVLEILVMVVFYLLRVSRREAFPLKVGINIPRIALGLIAFLFFIMVSSMVSSLLALPDNGTTELFMKVMDNSWCLLAMCVVGPLFEEVIFREGVLRSLLASRWNVTWAIVFSSLCFSVLHGNWAQMVSAFILGIVLGIFYVRTGNLWFCTLAHILNNSLAVFLLKTSVGGAKGAELSIGYTVAYIFVYLAIGVVLLKLWWGKEPYRPIENDKKL